MQLRKDSEVEDKRALEANSDAIYKWLQRQVGRTAAAAAAHGRNNPLSGATCEEDRPWPWDKMETQTSKRDFIEAAHAMHLEYQCRLPVQLEEHPQLQPFQFN